MDVITMIKKTGVFLTESVQQKIWDQIDFECRESERFQKNRDVTNAVRMLVHLKHTDSEIYEMMHEYFGLNNIKEVGDLILKAKVSRQIRGIVELLLRQGKNVAEAKDFVKSHGIEDKLRRDSRLLEMSPEKLLKEVEKKSN